MNKIQSRDVRDAFLSQMPEAIERLMNFAQGFDVNEDGSRGEFTGQIMPDILLHLTNKAIPMMTLEDDQTENIELKRASTIQEITNLQKDGLISMKQANQYIEILKTNYEITELNQLIEKLEELER